MLIWCKTPKKSQSISTLTKPKLFIPVKQLIVLIMKARKYKMNY